MELVTHNLVYTAKYAAGSVDLTAGQWVRIQTGAADAPVTQLQVQVPAGKTWKVSFVVEIEEQDA